MNTMYAYCICVKPGSTFYVTFRKEYKFFWQLSFPWWWRDERQQQLCLTGAQSKLNMAPQTIYLKILR